MHHGGEGAHDAASNNGQFGKCQFGIVQLVVANPVHDKLIHQRPNPLGRGPSQRARRRLAAVGDAERQPQIWLLFWDHQPVALRNANGDSHLLQ